MLQKRAIRGISKSKFLAHTDPIFADLKLLKLDDMYLLNISNRTVPINVFFFDNFSHVCLTPVLLQALLIDMFYIPTPPPLLILFIPYILMK